MPGLYVTAVTLVHRLTRLFAISITFKYLITVSM